MECWGMIRIAGWCVLAISFSGFSARAQDTFEIQVYEYETVPKGMWNLETHLNFVQQGTHYYEGRVTPTNHQTHLTYELTHGITNYFELAGYLVLAQRAGAGPIEYAGSRIRPRVALPRSWGLPVDVSISAEVGFPRPVYEENSVTLEIRPIIEKVLGRWQFDVNPVVARALRGPGHVDGWEFEPGVRIGFEHNKRIDWTLEYYAATGPLLNPFSAHDQVHMIFPGCDLHLTPNIVWNLGIGVAATPAGNQLTYKMRLGTLFGHKRD
jgi:hypothetical protein